MKIKEGLEEKFKRFVELNSEDDYSKATVDATIAVGEALDRGLSPEEALKEMNDRGLTGYMAGVAIHAVALFNPRGDEMAKYWNKSWGREDAKGVVNPAIVTFKDKKDAG